MNESNPVRGELDALVREAVRRDATGLFLLPGEPPAFRVGGKIERSDGDPWTSRDVSDLALAVFGRERLDRLGPATGVEQDLVRLSDDLSVAVVAARTAGAPTLVLTPMRPAPIDARALGLPAEALASVESGGGLVVVTGPPGCGKTTTAYALLEHVNATRDVHVLAACYFTEIVLEPKRALLTQRRVGVDAPDMVSALGSGLLCDPDVLYAAEIRDVESLSACLSAADAGRLVVTQLHQPTPAAAIRRIVDLHPADLRPTVRETLARTLRCVVTQRLLPRSDGKGRVAAFGWLVPDATVRAAIAPGGDLSSLDSLGPPAQHTWEESAARLIPSR